MYLADPGEPRGEVQQIERDERDQPELEHAQEPLVPELAVDPVDRTLDVAGDEIAAQVPGQVEGEVGADVRADQYVQRAVHGAEREPGDEGHDDHGHAHRREQRVQADEHQGRPPEALDGIEEPLHQHGLDILAERREAIGQKAGKGDREQDGRFDEGLRPGRFLDGI